jgi:peptidoglycan/LPS O-acetylase OafA/YrhL
MHIPAIMFFKKLPLPNFGYNLNWCATIAFIMGISYLFYLCVERPSHRLARKFRAIAGLEMHSPIQSRPVIEEAGSTPQSSSAMNS